MATRDIKTEYQPLTTTLRESVPNIEEIIGSLAGLEPLADRLDVELMTVEQVLEIRAQLGEQSWIFDNLLFVFEDRSGDYFGVWVKGQLAGRWSWHHHDETDLSPLFRSAASLRRAFDAKPEATTIYDLPRDFPDIEAKATAAEVEADRAIIEHYRAAMADVTPDDEAMLLFYAFNVIELTPRADLAQLVGFLDHENMYVRERAVVTLGSHRYEPARAKLQHLAVHDQGNAGLAAKGAMRLLDGA